MKSIIITISFVLISLVQTSTENKFSAYQQYSVEAYRYKQNEKYNLALDAYEKALKNVEGKSADYLDAALCAYQLKKPSLVKHYLSEAIRQTTIKEWEIYKYSEVFEESIYKEYVESNFQSIRKKFYEERDDLYAYLQVEKLTYLDQFSRRIVDYHNGVTPEMKGEAFDQYFEAKQKDDTAAMRKYKAILFPPKDEVLDDLQLKVMNTTDSLNAVKLIEICKDYGWQDNAWILLWHHRGTYGKQNFVWDFFVPFINQEIESGNVAPSFWAVFEDFKCIRENGYSKYGFHPGKVLESEVNEARRSIGLPELLTSEIEERNKNPFAGRMY